MQIRRGITDIGSLIYGSRLEPDTGTGSGGGGEGNGQGEGDGASPDGKAKVTFTDEQQAEINRIVGKEVKAAAEKARKAAEEAQQQREADAKRQKDADDAAARGEFDTAKAKYETDLTAEREKAKALTEQNEKLVAAMKSGVDAQWDKLPERVRKTGEKVAPDPDDVLGRFTYLNDPDTVEWVKELAGQSNARGNGEDPKGSGGNGPEVKSLISKQQAGFS